MTNTAEKLQAVVTNNTYKTGHENPSIPKSGNIVPFTGTNMQNTQSTITIDISTLNALINNAVASQLQAHDVLIEKQQAEAIRIAKNEKQLAKEERLSNPHKAYNGTTDPIKDLSDIQAAKAYFLNQDVRFKSNPTNIRDYTLFVVGCNTARRISDLLRLRICDVLNDDYTIRHKIKIVEQKTGKVATFFLNDTAQDAIILYLSSLSSYNMSDMLFKSRKGDNQPIGRKQAWNIMKKMSKAIGLDEKGVNVGTHTLRKTFGYHLIKNGNHDNISIATLKEILNHSSEAVTRAYCGIREDELEEAFDTVQI